MCGVLGVTIPLAEASEESEHLSQSAWAAYEVYRGALTLQHRGQDAAGIASYDQSTSRIFHHKGHGLIADVFDKASLDKLKGLTAIAHNRYATVGTQEMSDIQPVVTGFPTGMALAHNGNIVNYHALSRDLRENFGIQTLSGNDIEIFLYYLSLHLAHKVRMTKNTPAFAELCMAAHELMCKASGGYAIVGLFSNGSLMGMRDPNGIRPLILGEKQIGNLKAYCLASETVALNFLGFEIVRDVAPGELILIDKKGMLHSKVVGKAQSHKPCMFEWVYFSSAESQFENRSIYQTRLRLGKELAKQIKKAIEDRQIKPDIIVPVPDTSRTAAIALAEEISLPYREALIKNRYTFRSFILSSQEKREKAVELKLSPVLSEIKDKSILLVDDSVVRGTTARKIVRLLKHYGAREVTIAVTCPPIIHPCFYGVDLSTRSQLIASDKNLEEIASYLEADHIFYISEADLARAIGVSEFCAACLNGVYPTNIEEAECFSKHRHPRYKQSKISNEVMS